MCTMVWPTVDVAIVRVEIKRQEIDLRSNRRFDNERQVRDLDQLRNATSLLTHSFHACPSFGCLSYLCIRLETKILKKQCHWSSYVFPRHRQ